MGLQEDKGYGFAAGTLEVTAVGAPIEGVNTGNSGVPGGGADEIVEAAGAVWASSICCGAVEFPESVEGSCQNDDFKTDSFCTCDVTAAAFEAKSCACSCSFFWNDAPIPPHPNPFCYIGILTFSFTCELYILLMISI